MVMGKRGLPGEDPSSRFTEMTDVEVVMGRRWVGNRSLLY